MPWHAVPEPLVRLSREQEGLVSVAQCVRWGVSRDAAAHRAARGMWERVTTGVYDVRPAQPPSDLDGGRRRAAWTGLLALGDGAIAVGPCALAMLGVAGLPSRIEAQVSLPGAAARRSRGQVAVRRFDDGMQVVRVGGARVAAPRWAIAQAVPELPRAHALAVLDSALALGVIDARGLDLAHAVARGRRGVATHHELWEIADGRAQSPLESYGRLACVDAGLPPDTLQLVVRDAAGRFVGRADMGWRIRGGRWLVVEMDGREIHGTPEAVFADRERQNALLATGRVEVLRFTSRDAPERIAAAVGNLLRRHRTG
ncbi:hypothetical protein [Cellulomonas sp. PhB143]|uniref:hypothetical protein n=1 Tax=Cellulomonas sp. PhB143 TaxID=2485186 RepID=UPI000F49F2B9|nr:hypothetical protein [Cellulomonas sp. PhB143]ROS76559.1 hypothetical protein EDF32_1378 [Cellulomonas sp. PhB143]